jgi:biopolymer transport protein ExbB
VSAWLDSITGYWVAGGPLLAALAVVQALLWAHFFRARRHFMNLLAESCPLTERLNVLAGGASLADVRGAVCASCGGLSTLMTSALDHVGEGAVAAGVFAQQEALALRWWRRELLVLGALTAVAPLLGLLGTVSGMMATFDAVAGSAGGTAQRVADGISAALITTQFGLIIALPGVFGLARLEQLIRSLEVRLAECRSLILAALQTRPDGEIA